MADEVREILLHPEPLAGVAVGTMRPYEKNPDVVLFHRLNGLIDMLITAYSNRQ